jgi:hypothetical protein
MIGAELNSYGVVVRYMSREQATTKSESASEQTWSLISTDRRRVAVDYTVPNTLTVKQRTAGIKYDPYEVRNAAQILKNNKYADLARNNNHEFVPLINWSQSHLEGLGTRLSSSSAR